MKPIFLIALLVVITGCNVSKKSVKKECVIKGIERDFSECEKSQNPQVANKETVRVSINFSIDLQEDLDQLDIMGNYYDSNFSKDGRECAVEVFSGTRLRLRKVGQSLTTQEGGKFITYTRKGSRDQGYLGGWYVKKITASGIREEYLTLHSQSAATLTVDCHFND